MTLDLKDYQIPNYSTELHKRSFIPHSLFQYYWLQLHCHFFHLLCILSYVNLMSKSSVNFIMYVCYVFIKRDWLIDWNILWWWWFDVGCCSESASVLTSVRPDVRWATPAGSCTVWSTASSLMVRCPVTRPLEEETTRSTRSSVRLELENTSHVPSLLTLNPL